MRHLLIMISVLAVNGVLSVTISREPPTFEVLILHNNDMHARFEQTSRLSSTCSAGDAKKGKCYGGFARVANRVRAAREEAKAGKGPPVLYLNAGDTYTGTVWFAVYQWEIAAAFINILQPDAVSLGNHEFDKGVSGLTPFIENLTCPVLCANIDVHKEPKLESEANLRKSTVFNINGTKIGVIGYLTPDTKFLVAPNQVEYEDEVPAIQREVDKLKSEGVNILIALGHSGYDTDRRIARNVKGIDLVIGGHTNTFLWNGNVPDVEEKQGPYPTMEKQSSGKLVPVVQAYAYTKYLGKLHVIFNSEGELIEFDGEPILLNSTIPQEPDVLSLLEKFRPGITELSKKVVGKTKVLLGGNNTMLCRIDECNLGNMLTDAMIYNYLLDYKDNSSWTDAPAAVLQGGGIRSFIDVKDVDGNITRADIMSVLPFDNAIVAVVLTGEILMLALEQSVYNYSPLDAPGGFLQYSGLHVTYDLSKPSGSRLVSAYIRCGKCNVPEYTMVRKEDSYKILIPEFLYQGGDGFTMFRDNVTSSDILQFNDVETVVNYLADKTPIYPEVEGRIKFAENNKSKSSGNRSRVMMISSNIAIAIICFIATNFRY